MSAGVNQSAVGRKMNDRADSLFGRQRQEISVQTDRMFAGLMIFQWLAGIAAAVWISPKAWAGAASATHPHVWAALVLGGAITAFPVFLALRYPGGAFTRHVIAAGQMLMSALLIHLSGGRIETHFHIFGSLAFLAFYRDPRVLVTATAVVLIDHLWRGIYWPESVFGVASASVWRAFEHAGGVAFEDFFLIVYVRRSLREMRRNAEQHAQLEATNEVIEQAVTERTAELAAANVRLGREMAERKDAQMLAEHANKELTEFAYVVSHDLKAPLRGIGSLAGWLHKDYADKIDEDGREQLTLMLGRVNRMNALIDGILSYSRAGRAREGEMEVDLGRLVPNTIDLLAPPAHIRTEIVTPLPRVVMEPTKAQQLFQNLLSNAIKYMDKPQGHVRVSCEAEDDGFWRFSVADNGPGIEEKYFERIFQLFQTLAPRDSVEGTGVGLALAKKSLNWRAVAFGSSPRPAAGRPSTSPCQRHPTAHPTHEIRPICPARRRRPRGRHDRAPLAARTRGAQSPPSRHRWRGGARLSARSRELPPRAHPARHQYAADERHRIPRTHEGRPRALFHPGGGAHHLQGRERSLQYLQQKRRRLHGEAGGLRPIRGGDAQDPRLLDAERNRPLTPLPMSAPLSILLIEDDFVDQMTFTAHVAAEKLPYQVQVAGSIAEARQLLKSCAFDLIIADYQLGDGTSFDLFDVLETKLVIFATGAGDEEIAARAMRLGVRDYLIKDPERKYLKLLSYRVDSVMRQWRSEQALRESEERYRELFESASDLIQSVAMDGSILFVNPAWRTAMGYSEEEVRELKLMDLIHPSSLAHCMEMFHRVMRGDTVGNVEAVFVTREGREIIVEGNASCHFENGKPVSTRAIFRDITERKRAEQALQAANEELKTALAEVKQLQGILPICMYCKKIRDDGDYWHEVEAYVRQRTEAEFSHGICPDCFAQWKASHEAGGKTFGARTI